MKATKKTGGPRFVAASIGKVALVATAFCVATAPSPSFADTVTADAALAAAKGWVNLRQSMDGGAFSAPESAKAYPGAEGRGTYYVVSLSGGGYVVTSGDTFLKPVLSYAASGAWEENEAKNPLALFVKCDVAASAAAMPEAGSAVASANAAEWAKLAAAASQKSGSRRLAATAPTADLRVSPLLTTAWNQGSVGGALCYNYYTPGNYLCGCAATAMAQVMKYFRYPTAKVTAGEGYYDSVNYNGTDVGWNMDGYFASATAATKTPWSPAFGGPYDWDAMVDSPTSSTSETARKAIGQICRDAGLTVFAHYNVNNSGETSGFNGAQASALVKTFGYTGATASPYNENAMLASLDAGLPVIVELAGNGGHAVVADGYGYDGSGTLYVHFNFGWGESAGGSDRWYTPPSVAAFTSIPRMIAAIFTPAQGTRGSSVISGRVLDSNGSPVSGATVAAKNAAGAVVATKTTNAKGIYAFILPAGVYRLAAESGSDACERLCTVESTSSPLRLDDGWGGENTVNHSRSGIDLAFGQTTGLMHRWSFTSDYTDAKGTADGTASGSGVSISNGKAVLSGGNNAGYVNLGTGVLGDGDATLEVWFEKLANPASWACAFSYGVDGSNKFYVNTAYGYNDEYGGNTGSSFAPVGITIGGTGYGLKEGLEPLLPNLPQHMSVTFKKNSDGSTTVRFMSRDAVTGFLLRDYTKTIPSWTLADASSFVLALGQETAGTYIIKSQFDEVRVWKGVLSDEQLSANVLAGPDAPLGDGLPVADSAEGIVVVGGETFAVPSATGGYGYWTDKKVLLGSGAKIRFDTTGYFGKALRFRTGGFVLPAGSSSPLDFVELSDSENYTATMEDANTVLVQLKPTVPYESTWSGGTPATAADLANAANWTSVNAQGDAVAAAPTAKTTAVIPASSLASFTLPAGASVGWGRTILGGHSGTQWGKIASTGGNNNWITFRERVLADYTANGAKEVSYLNRTNSNNHPSELGGSQLRFDGWINVSAAQAGRWNIRCSIDDMIAFAIDGDWQFMHNTWRYGVKAGCYVSEGWHRFTLIVRDTGGGWGMSTALNGTNYPFVLSVNGGTEIGFSQLTFGSGTASVALSGDADWRALGAITLDSGLTIDLNGHSLSFMSVASTHVGATLKNTSSSVSLVSGTVDATSVIVGDNVLLTAGLAHRWTFNSDFTDSVGGSDAVVMKNDTATTSIVGGTASISGGKAVLPGGDKAGYLNLGAGVLGKDDATLEFWTTRTTDPNWWRYLFTYGLHDQSPANLFTMAVSCGGGNDARWGLMDGNINGSNKASGRLVGMAVGVLYHVSVTFKKNDNGSTTVRYMIRDGETGFLLSETSATVAGWTLADAAEAGWMLTLGNNPYDNNWSDLACEFDDVRVWHGVLSDEQLLLNAVAGPDAPGGGEGDVIVLGGTVAASTPGGYGFSTDSQVMIASGAKIVFDTANYNGTALRFKTGGFILPSGVSSVLDLVELTDADNFTATTEDGGNTIKVSLKSTMPLTSVWKGGTPSTAADLANAANWESTNADGTTVNAAPGSRTTVIIPANKLAAFTIPADVTASLGWGRVLLGGYTVTTIGNKAAAPNPRLSDYRDYELSQYTVLSETGIDYANGNGTAFQNSYLANKQLRFDGWVYVDETQAGRWNLASSFDDVLSFAIDGKWIFLRPKWEPAMTAGCFVSAGWHRFTLVEADTGGGKGCNNEISNTKVPFSISINGGAAVAFHSAFTFGTEAPSVTLDADRNWAAMGPVTFENGLTIDLNGHNLTLAGGTSDYVGAKIVNSNTSADSTIYTYSGTIDTSLTSGSAGTVNVSTVPPVEAYWTGAGGTGLANDHRNWNCYSAANKSGLLPGALPTANTVVTDDSMPTNRIVEGDSLSWKQMILGSASGKAGYIEQTGGSLALGATITSIGNVSGGTGYYKMTGGALTTSAGSEFRIGNNGTAVFEQTGGAITIGEWVSVGRAKSSTSTYTISGGSISAPKADRPMWIAGEANAKGTLNICGKAVVSLNGITIPNNSSANGTVNMSDGTMNLDGFNIGNNGGTATINLSGGTMNVRYIDLGNKGTKSVFNMTGGILNMGYGQNGNLWIGRNGSATAKFNMTGGTLNFPWNRGSIHLGELANCKGYLTIGGDAVLNATMGINVGVNASGTGYLTLTGGVVNATYIRKGSGTANVTFAGGKIVATNATDTAATFFNGLTSFSFGKGGLTFDTAGYDVTLSSGTLTSTASGSLLRKEGEGTFTMHTLPPVDDIYVDAGSLALSATVDNTASATRSLAIASGATLALGGNTLKQPVLAGAGTVQNGTLTVTKKICVNAGEKLTFSGVALDVTGTTVEVADPENLTQPFVFAESTTAITGKPSAARGWTVRKSADGKTLTIKRSAGVKIIVY